MGNCEYLPQSADNQSQKESRSSDVGCCSGNRGGRCSDAAEFLVRSGGCCAHLVPVEGSACGCGRGRAGRGAAAFLGAAAVLSNPYHTGLPTGAGILLPAKVAVKGVCLVFSSTTPRPGIVLDTFLSRHLKSDFYEII